MPNAFVVIVGVLDKVGSTNIPMAASFTKFGIQVLPVNYRTIIAKQGMQFFGEYLLFIIKKYNPILTLFSKCNGVDTNIIKECGKHSVTWLFNMDPRPTIERCPEVIDHAFNSHFSSCTAKDMVEWFESFGVKNCYHIIQGIDQNVFKPVEPVEEFKADISHIGTKTEERDQFKKVLEDAGFITKFYGTGYSSKEMFGNDFNEVCASSKFMLSLNTYNNIHQEYFSNRLLRYVACGVCTLHYDSTNSLDKYLTNGKEVLYFKDSNELVNILKNITDEKACEIAMAGRDKALNNYTWDRIIYDMLERVKREGKKADVAVE